MRVRPRAGPVEVYEWVRNTIQPEFYFGAASKTRSIKGTREWASKPAATNTGPRKYLTWLTSIIQVWWTKWV